jgi:hypothetical protein
LAGAGIIAALLFLSAAVAAARYLPLIEDARQLRTGLQDAIDRVQAKGLDLDRPALDAITADLDAADTRLARLRDALAADPLFGVFRTLAPTATQVLAADDLVVAATDLMAAGRDALAIGDQYVAIREAHAQDPQKLSALAGLVNLMAGSVDRAAEANAHVQAALSSLSRVPASGLISPLAQVRDLMVDRLDSYAPLLDAYVRADTVLPGILGWGGQKRYLVLAEDPAELRPTGGFIGTYGIVAFEGGRLVERTFHGIDSLDSQPGLPYVKPPAPLQGHLLGKYPWQLADANWSPDFPTSALQAQRFYTLESGDADVDGVIALTTYAIDRLLEVTGPVTVPEYDVTVAPGQTTEVVLKVTRESMIPGVDRKAFLDVFAAMVMDRVLALPPSRWPDLLDRVEAVRSERQAAVWLVDPSAQRLVVEGRWDGAVRQDAGDFVMPVDSNVAPASKYSIITDRSLSLQVAIDQVGNAENTLTFTWRNRLNDTGTDYQWLRETSTTDQYGSFFRLLVPERSRLVWAAGGTYGRITGAETVESEAGRTAFGNYLMIPPGQGQLAYRWISPYAAAVDSDGRSGLYRLTIQKQMGTLGDAVSLRITLPEGARLLNATPGLTIQGRAVTLDTRLAADLQLEVRYSLGP